MVLGGQHRQVFPERVADLEVVGLMAGAVEERLVAGEVEVLAGRGDADRLPALAVHVAPIPAEGTIPYDQGV